MARLKAEGQNTPADLLMTVDAGNLWQAAEEGQLNPIFFPTDKGPGHEAKMA